MLFVLPPYQKIKGTILVFMRPHHIEDKEKLLLFFPPPILPSSPGLSLNALQRMVSRVLQPRCRPRQQLKVWCRFGGGGVSPELRGTSNAEGSGDVLICGGASLEQSPSISPQGAELEIEIRRRPKQINPTLRSSKFCKCFNPDST